MEKKALGAFTALILGLSFAVGPGLMGFLLSKSISNFKKSANTVTVKGLVEKSVKSDRAEWVLGIRVAGNDAEQMLNKAETDIKTSKSFLLEAGVKQEEITEMPLDFTDRQAQEYINKDAKNRYYIVAGLKVSSANVDLVAKLPKQTIALAKQGVALDRISKPRFMLEKFNEMRPGLVSEATTNARNMAAQFARDSGVKVGAIASANQGVIRILPTGSVPEQEWDGAYKTIYKKLRVVSTLTFYLDDK